MSYSIGGGWERDLDRWLTTDPRDDEEPVCTCDMCGGDIYEGDTVYKVSGHTYCMDCMDDCKEIVEVEEE